MAHPHRARSAHRMAASAALHDGFVRGPKPGAVAAVAIGKALRDLYREGAHGQGAEDGEEARGGSGTVASQGRRVRVKQVV